jgi:hypothetical protein
MVGPPELVSDFCPNFCPSGPTGADLSRSNRAENDLAERSGRLPQTFKTGEVV